MKLMMREMNLSGHQLPENYPKTENISPMIVGQVFNDLQVFLVKMRLLVKWHILKCVVKMACP
jgi:hypothetical protein